MMDLPKRKSPRISGYDYSTPNYYFITICTHEHQCLFGKPNHLNQRGMIVREHIERLPGYYHGVHIDHFVVMPNHIHLIIVLDGNESDPNISSIVALFKTGVTKQIREKEPGIKIWQRSFHDHVIRNQKSYKKIWMYIEDNPRKWEEDCFYPKECVTKDLGRVGNPPLQKG